MKSFEAFEIHWSGILGLYGPKAPPNSPLVPLG
jgi:hypothetical protein